MALETPAQIAARYWDLIVWDLPPDWYGHYLRAIDNTRNPQALNDLAQRKLDPARLAIVVVGDRTSIEPDLAAIAPIEAVTSE
jgi:predicted Zn-dependent peptidase